MRCDRPAGSKTASIFMVRVTGKAGKDKEGLEQLRSRTFLLSSAEEMKNKGEKSNSGLMQARWYMNLIMLVYYSVCLLLEVTSLCLPYY